MLATIVPLLRRDVEMTMTDVEAALLVSMSAASVDRTWLQSELLTVIKEVRIIHR
jgi:hypothetical protein